jgi:hypothetical protein
VLVNDEEMRGYVQNGHDYRATYIHTQRLSVQSMRCEVYALVTSVVGDLEFMRANKQLVGACSECMVVMR